MLLMVTPAPLCHSSRSLSFHSCINCFVQYFGDPTLQCAFYRIAHVQCSVGWVKHSCSLQCKTQFDQHCNLKISPTVLSTSWFDQCGWSEHLMFDQYGWSVHCVRRQSNGNYASQTKGIPMCFADTSKSMLWSLSVNPVHLLLGLTTIAIQTLQLLSQTNNISCVFRCLNI